MRISLRGFPTSRKESEVQVQVRSQLSRESCDTATDLRAIDEFDMHVQSALPANTPDRPQVLQSPNHIIIVVPPARKIDALELTQHHVELSRVEIR